MAGYLAVVVFGEERAFVVAVWQTLLTAGMESAT